MKFAKRLAASIAGVSVFTLASLPVAAQSYYDYSYGAADAAAASAFTGLSILSCCLPFLCWLVIAGALAFVVYKDAQKNKVENAAIWAVITFFFSLIGILVYFLAIKPEAMKKSQAVEAKTEKEESK